MTKIILMRHGKTVYAKGTFVGFTDLGLSEEGIKQAFEVGKIMKGEGIDKIYCSSLKRAHRTALEVGKSLDLKPETTDALKESNFGIMDGFKADEAKRRFSDILDKRRNDIWNYRIPKGESFRDVADRSGKFIRKIVKENPGKTLLVVCHLDVIRAALVDLGVGEMEDIRKIYYPNASRVYLNYDGKKFFMEKTEGVEDG